LCERASESLGWFRTEHYEKSEGRNVVLFPVCRVVVRGDVELQ